MSQNQLRSIIYTVDISNSKSSTMITLFLVTILCVAVRIGGVGDDMDNVKDLLVQCHDVHTKQIVETFTSIRSNDLFAERHQVRSCFVLPHRTQFKITHIYLRSYPHHSRSLWWERPNLILIKFLRSSRDPFREETPSSSI